MPAPSCPERDIWFSLKMFHGMPANHLQRAQELVSWKSLGPLPPARRCRRGPDRRHAMRGERRAARSVPAIGITILRRAAAPIASVPGQFRPGNIRRSRGPMRSRRNRQHHSERSSSRTSGCCSDAFELAQTSRVAGSPTASSHPRRAFENLAGSSRLLPLGLLDFSGRALERAFSLPAVDLPLASTLSVAALPSG